MDPLEEVDLHTDPVLLHDDMLDHQLLLIETKLAQMTSRIGSDAIPRDEDSEETETDDSAPPRSTTLPPDSYRVPPHAIPIRCDVRDFDWEKLGEWCQFDVIMMDPPWQLASRAPTRGVALGYSQLRNREIIDMPIPLLQAQGFLFIWVINSRYTFALEMMEYWGYTLVDDITWVKSTVNGRLAKGHGFYLQHAKETCLVGWKGDPTGNTKTNVQRNIASDVIIAERRGQSQKPEEIYHLIEELVPQGKYLEIFARRNNLRNYWVSVGLEL